MSSNDSQSFEIEEALKAARQALYRFAALCLADPRTGSWRALVEPGSRRLIEEAVAVVRDEKPARPRSLGPGERGLESLEPAPVFDRLPASEDELHALYERCFGLVVSGACPPHETDYVEQKLVFRRSHELADVSGFYRAFGVEPSRSNPERCDHIVLELEFLAFLLSQERRAVLSTEVGGSEKANTCRDAQKKFLEDHLSWWAPAFARLLEREDPRGFYGATAQFLSALIPTERAFLDVEAHGCAPSPSSIEPPEACASCALQP